MQKSDKQQLTDAQKKAAEFLTRPKPDFAVWRREREVAAAARATIGDVMEDGTVYAGFSPERNAYMFVPTEGSPALVSFNQAAQYVRECSAHGYTDWQLPTREELKIFIINKEAGALKGTFNARSYWSSTADEHNPDFNCIVDSKYCSVKSYAYRDNEKNIEGCRPVRYVAAAPQV